MTDAEKIAEAIRAYLKGRHDWYNEWGDGWMDFDGSINVNECAQAVLGALSPRGGRRR